MFRLFLLIAFVLALPRFMLGQSTWQPLDPDIYHWIDRADIRSLSLQGKFHSTVRPVSREETVQLMDSLAKQGNLSRTDRFHIRWFREVNSEFSAPDSSGMRKQLFGAFFRRKADLLSYRDSVFDVHANIAGHGALGKSNDGSGEYLINSRGVEVRGTIAGKVGFYTFMTDNQMLMPGYVNDWTRQFGSLPHEGFWKRVGSRGYDFFSARGYFTFQAGRHIAFQAGHDRFQIGQGYRSLILSDFGNPFTFLRINTSVWKFQYTNIFASLKTDVNALGTGIPGNRRIPGKLFVFHRLGMNIGRRFNLGLFEAVIAGRDPLTQAGSSFPDPSYFNPIIFYRAIEQNSGSPDNAGLGLDARYTAWKSLRLYGQFFLDEFLLARFREGNGWWGNKFGVQGGFHYINVAGISNLDLQGEFNIVRPFTYTHLNNYSSYAHYAQPLAHPLGANFREAIGIIRYQPVPAVNISAKAIFFQRGLDSTAKSFGSNVLKSYTLRVSESGNSIAQGVRQEVWMLDFTVSWQVWTNFFLDFKQVWRREQRSAVPYEPNFQLSSLSVRWNMPQRLHEF